MPSVGTRQGSHDILALGPFHTGRLWPERLSVMWYALFYIAWIDLPCVRDAKSSRIDRMVSKYLVMRSPSADHPLNGKAQRNMSPVSFKPL